MAAARFTAVVVFPTPPFRLTTAITCTPPFCHVGGPEDRPVGTIDALVRSRREGHARARAQAHRPAGVPAASPTGRTSRRARAELDLPRHARVAPGGGRDHAATSRRARSRRMAAEAAPRRR